jgi:hypothetical protein
MKNSRKEVRKFFVLWKKRALIRRSNDHERRCRSKYVSTAQDFGGAVTFADSPGAMASSLAFVRASSATLS